MVFLFFSFFSFSFTFFHVYYKSNPTFVVLLFAFGLYLRYPSLLKEEKRKMESLDFKVNICTVM